MREKNNLHRWILIGMGIGLVLGGILNYLGQFDTDAAQEGVQSTLAPDTLESLLWWLDLLGKDIFIGSLKMIIAPLIFASIVSGITSLPSMRELGAIGWKTFAYYATTTSVAVAIGLAAVLIIRPGHQEASLRLRETRQTQISLYEQEFLAQNPAANLDDPATKQSFLLFIAAKEGESQAQGKDASKWTRISAAKERGPGEMFRQDILLPILSNPIQSLAETNSLGIIFFAILTGLACIVLGAKAASVTSFFQGLNEVMMKITLWVMNIAPLAIGCLIASTVAKQGIDALISLGWYCATVVIGIGAHVIFLLTLVAVLGKMSPLTFLKGIRSAWLIAFSTTSSAATLPVTMECVTKNLKVSPKVSNFALPVGATCNMDGTALYEGVAVIFLIQIYGGLADAPIVLTAAKTLIIFITAVLASIGAAAVPSAGLITMALVAGAVGLPLHYIPILFAVDHLLDMFRTSTNVMGDMVGTVLVNHWEKDRLEAMEAAQSPEPSEAAG